MFYKFCLAKKKKGKQALKRNFEQLRVLNVRRIASAAAAKGLSVG
jgi:hypothetical protein